MDAALSPRCTFFDSDISLKLQHTLTQQLSEQRFKALYDNLDPLSRRIVDSAMEKHAGSAWLKAIPTVPEHSIPSDKMVVIALRHFLWNFIAEGNEGVSYLQEED